MRLHFEFNNGTAPVDFVTKMEQSTPIELIVPSSNAQTKVIYYYINALVYLFEGLINYAANELVIASIEKGWFGKVEKRYDNIIWDSELEVQYIVVYELGSTKVQESLYVAREVNVVKDPVTGVMRREPVWLKDLLIPKQSILKENIISAVFLATQFCTEHKLVWGYNGENGLSILNSEGKKVALHEIKNDDYTLLQLLLLLLKKGSHTGVFIIDCEGMSDHVINSLVETSKVFFGDSFIFLYNTSIKTSIERVSVNLPDFTLRKGLLVDGVLW